MSLHPNDEHFMDEALKEARLALEEGEVPVGAVVVQDGVIIGRGHNSREHGLDIAGHAEINAINDAARSCGRWSLEGCTLFATLEPCMMCAGAIRQSRIRTVVFGAKDEEEGAIVSAFHAFDADNGLITVSYGTREAKYQQLLRDFFVKKRKGI